MLKICFGDQSQKKRDRFASLFFGRGGGIRTPGTLRYNGFQDRRVRPLCHSSVWSKLIRLTAKAAFSDCVGCKIITKFPFRQVLSRMDADLGSRMDADLADCTELGESAQSVKSVSIRDSDNVLVQASS